jgi:hypothetical protein
MSIGSIIIAACCAALLNQCEMVIVCVCLGCSRALIPRDKSNMAKSSY